MSVSRSVVIHGHYYQPPREDPWLDEVARERTAAPYHDWNARIEQECYRAVAAARVEGPDGRIARIVNTLAHSSFDAAPTLLGWLEREAPDTFAAFLEADAASRLRLGFGNAVAAPFHHIILPLASRRDKVAEVRWGITDFRARFGREPEGLWLPETAVDDETLDVLAAEGIAFTILAPSQVTHLAPGGRPGRYRTGGGRTIALFCYDGDIAHDVAFGALVRDAGAWTTRLTRDATCVLASVAVDGETFGHHHRFGEMALAAVLESCAAHPRMRVENFASYLARHPATHDVELVAPSAWSCTHGVERWRSDCGCRMEPGRAWQQGWRAPLRNAMDWLVAEVHALCDAPAPGDGVAAREREWMERHALAACSSCGWFFDDLAGLEAVLVMRQAARAVELAGAEAPRLEAGLLERLARGVSNDPAAGDGARIYRERARPAVPAPARVAAAAAALARLQVTDVRPLRGYTTAVGGAAVTVTDVRTGRAWRFEAATEPLESSPSGVVVREAGGAEVHVCVADFPEAARDAVRLSRALAMVDLDPGDAAALRTCAQAAAALGAALVAAVRKCVAAGRGDTGHATSLARALAVLDVPIPFEAQTTFFRWRAALPPEQAASLAPLAHALGFAA